MERTGQGKSYVQLLGRLYAISQWNYKLLGDPNPATAATRHMTVVWDRIKDLPSNRILQLLDEEIKDSLKSRERIERGKAHE